MDVFNLVITRLFDGFLYPFHHLDPIWGVTAVSIPTGIVLVWLFGKMSNQQRIRTLKSRIKGHMLEMWIFRDNSRVVLGAQGRVLANVFKYALCSLRPLIVLIIPVILIMIQLDARYGVRPLNPGESAIVKIVYAQSPTVADMDAVLEVPDEITIETPALRMPSAREVDFRLSAREKGRYKLTVKAADRKLTKALQVGEPGQALSSVRSRSFLDRLLNPAEPGMPNGPLASVEICYPKTQLSLWGMEFHWLWPFFIISIVTGFALKGTFGVEL